MMKIYIGKCKHLLGEFSVEHEQLELIRIQISINWGSENERKIHQLIYISLKSESP